ncbi:MAG: TIGR01777 family protein [Elusimicrobia bacterium]|nr:TIGR01777 family protein [Elusimicrobiota bacterium]
MRIVIAGATGFVGRALCEALARSGHDITVLVRRTMGGPRALPTVFWDGRPGGEWAGALEGADAVINLAGAPVASRWTEARKSLLRESRILTTRALVSALSAAARPPKVLVNASAVGCYGDRGDAECREDADVGEGFLADLCRDWEAEAAKFGGRTVLLRLGMVLAADGGALPLMALPFWLRVGGPVGTGRQWVSWISRRDLERVVEFVLAGSLEGPVNATAPAPATNSDFSRALGLALGRPCWLRAPGFALRLALGEMAGMLLTGQKAPPTKLLGAGFCFEHETIDAALAAIFQ